MRRVPSPADLRAAGWTLRALGRARRGLAAGRVQVGLPPPPTLSPAAVRGVEAALRRRAHTCLEGALIRQRWWTAQGVRHDVVIGVTSPATGFSAHAWLDDGDCEAVAAVYTEITRLAP